MNIDIQTSGIDSGKEFHHITRCSAGYELGTFRNQIARVLIRVSSIPESQNGRDISCEVQIEFYAGDSVFSHAADSNPHVAVHWALERGGWTIARRQQGAAVAPRVGDLRPASHHASSSRGNADRLA